MNGAQMKVQEGEEGPTLTSQLGKVDSLSITFHCAISSTRTRILLNWFSNTFKLQAIYLVYQAYYKTGSDIMVYYIFSRKQIKILV